MVNSLFMDLIVNGITIYTGMPCDNLIGIGNYISFPFNGILYFNDSMDGANPTYDGLGSEYFLYYYQTGVDVLLVPLQAIPSQQFDITLGGQSCTISLYTCPYAPSTTSGQLLQIPNSILNV
jgi:hypothetical protein